MLAAAAASATATTASDAAAQVGTRFLHLISIHHRRATSTKPLLLTLKHSPDRTLPGVQTAFAMRGVQVRGDASAWTDTPQEKLLRLQRGYEASALQAAPRAGESSRILGWLCKGGSRLGAAAIVDLGLGPMQGS